MLRLAPVAALVWTAAGAAIAVPEAAAALGLVLWAAAAVALVLALRRPGPLTVICLLACALAAAAAIQVAWAQPARAQLLGLPLDGGRAVEMHAVVTGKVEPRDDGRLAFDARATRVVIGDVASAVDAPIDVVVTVDDVLDPATLDLGSLVVARGTTYPARDADRAVVVLHASRGVEVIAAPAGALAVAAQLRRSLVSAAGRLPAPGALLVPGLAVGDTSLVDADLDAAMKTASLAHLTAVSGANCALVTGLAFAAAAVCGAGRRLRVTVGAAALIGFVVLVSPEPSVVRAAAMSAVAMLAVLLGRPGAGAAGLCVAIGLLLVTDPWLAGSLGFALSVAATGALLLFARPIAVGLSTALPRPLAVAIAVPLAAQAACGPLLTLIDASVPVYGVPANLLAGPAAPLATVLGLAACLSAPVPGLQAAFTAFAWLPASWIAGTATSFSALPGARLPWVPGPAGVLLLGVIGGAVVVVLAPTRHRPLRHVALLLLAGTAGIATGGAWLSGPAGAWTLPARWSVLACDVGQGDAVLVRSAGVVLLVDTGPEPAPLDRCLTRAGIGHIEVLVLTHFDLDHVGGVAAVTSRSATVLHPPPRTDAERAVVRALTDAGAHSVTAAAGVAGTVGDARWTVLWPRADGGTFTHGNDGSVVLDVRGGGIPASLFLGDLSAEPQQALAAGDMSAPYDLVKVAHHGSADQHPGLYRVIAARIALITVGAGNRYGHPRPELLDLVSATSAAVARTDRDGMVAIWSESGELRLWRERGGVAGPD